MENGCAIDGCMRVVHVMQSSTNEYSDTIFSQYILQGARVFIDVYSVLNGRTESETELTAKNGFDESGSCRYFFLCLVLVFLFHFRYVGWLLWRYCVYFRNAMIMSVLYFDANEKEYIEKKCCNRLEHVTQCHC